MAAPCDALLFLTVLCSSVQWTASYYTCCAHRNISLMYDDRTRSTLYWPFRAFFFFLLLSLLSRNRVGTKLSRGVSCRLLFFHVRKWQKKKKRRKPPPCHGLHQKRPPNHRTRFCCFRFSTATSMLIFSSSVTCVSLISFPPYICILYLIGVRTFFFSYVPYLLLFRRWWTTSPSEKQPSSEGPASGRYGIAGKTGASTLCWRLGWSGTSLRSTDRTGWTRGQPR